jgi:esterase/lipase superfamily enzyme
VTKTGSKWYSQRLEQEINLVRWGHWGQPVLMFPTAGGDAEEIERMHLVGAVGELIEAGRIKVYSCDSISGRAFASRTGSVDYRCALLNRFEECIAQEVVPAIRTDCNSDSIEVIASGASLGAFHAVAVAARYPWLFSAAIGMSGSYDMEGLMGFRGTEDYYFSAPLSFVPNLAQGRLLDALRRRFFVLAYGGGRWENPEESWRIAGVLGSKGVPNRVDPWGPEYDHDWPTWRAMLPLYLDDLAPGKEG